MNDVEKKGIGKAGVGLLVLTGLVAVLIMSNVLIYVSLQRQIDSLESNNNDLNTQVSSLQAERNSLKDRVGDLRADKLELQSQVSVLETENSQLEGETDFLASEVADLEWEIFRLQQFAEERQFDFYYASKAKQRFGVYDLDEYLDRWEWIEGTYIRNVFDCSEMSAYIEWRLENEGYNTVIVCGESPWGGGYHAWLLVETSDDAYMPVEATEYNIVWWSNAYFDNYFEYDHLFENIHEALDYSYSEFDWWN